MPSSARVKSCSENARPLEMLALHSIEMLRLIQPATKRVLEDQNYHNRMCSFGWSPTFRRNLLPVSLLIH